MHSARIVTEANATQVTDAVLATVDDQTVEMLVGPAEDHLQRVVQIGNRHVSTDEQAASDQWADTAQDDAQLVNEGC